MNISIKPNGLRLRLALAAVLAAAIGAVTVSERQGVKAATPVTIGAPLSTQTATNYLLSPVTVPGSPPPIVMLTMTHDHALHAKAYNDYSALDSNNPNTIQTTYTGTIDYYGYFDNQVCYTYSTGSGYFTPSSLASVDASNNKYCNSGSTTNEWSGNFLNWASMTRMDAVRKLLYGGFRSTDSSSLTVLERDYLPGDAHAFAKYYNGTDIAKLVPSSFSIANTAPTKSYTFSSSISYSSSGVSGSGVSNSGGNYFVTLSGFGSGTYIGDQVQLTDSGSGGGTLLGVVQAGTNLTGAATTSSSDITVEVFGGSFSGSGTLKNVTVSLLSQTGISFCNITTGGNGSDANSLSHTNTNPPLLRVAKGNFALWNASENKECRWYGEVKNAQSGYANGVGSNGNRYAFSGLTANAENADQTALGLSVTGLSSQGEFIARVQACVTGFISSKGQRCEQYPSGDYKPIGLLQLYGEDGRINFGMVTTSYGRNISGGVLRKNAASFANEVNLSTDGTFSSATGIVYTLNKLRAFGYHYGTPGSVGDAGYTSSPDSCTYRLAGLVHSGGSNSSGQNQTEGYCSTWGNSLSEAYLETLRFLAGKSATTAFDPTQNPAFSAGTDPDSVLGLHVITPTDPLNSGNYCANLNVIAFNTSVSSYDGDLMDVASGAKLSDIGSSSPASSLTNTLGSREGISGNQWFIGSSDGVSNGQCTAKTITNFGTSAGLCPEGPNQKGTYLIAGTAYYAHTNRIRSDTGSTGLNVPSSDTTSLKVSTYGVQLSSNLPKITIPVPGSTTGQVVTIVPAMITDLDGNFNNFGPGAIADMKIVSQDLVHGTGKIYVNWDNSTQGSDYDEDIWGLISYSFSGSPATTLQVTTRTISFSAGTNMGFGYVVSGTTQDGLHVHSGAKGGNQSPGFSYTDAANITVSPNTTVNASGGCNQCTISDPATTATYTLGTSSAQQLQEPLWYAAKYGGFTGTDNSPSAALPTNQWDAVNNNTGIAGADGVPDNFYLVTNPLGLENALLRVFNAILAKTASGTAAAVVANQREGDGAIYQALFAPSRTDNQNNTATWLGTVQSLFIDGEGNLRENNSVTPGTLAQTDFSSATGNPAVGIFFNTSTSTTEVNRFFCDPAKNPPVVNPPNPVTQPGCSTAPVVDSLDNLNTLWNARTVLAAQNKGHETSNRTYNSAAGAGSGRYIFTFVDKNLNGVVDSGELQPFVSTTFIGSSSNTYGLLNVGDSTSATNIVNFTRGLDAFGLRNRTIDYYNTNNSSTYPLGDVVDSTPVVVGVPAEAFDLLYNDQSYGNFRKVFNRRRQVVYIGANDGMLHAFNGGFFNSSNKSFDLTGNNSEVQHGLGTELWAYVPFNLLPHLTWLTSANYNHIYYFDGTPRVFDAHIFSSGTSCSTPPSDNTPQTCHPYGWGTLMVVGMRFGGGELSMPICSTPLATSSLTTPFNGLSTSCSTTAVTTMTTHSAYVVLDITNPEEPPAVIAEITGTDPLHSGVLGFTTMYPGALSFSARNGTSSTPPSTDSWYMTLGNGPTNLGTANTAQNATLYLYQLNAGNPPTATSKAVFDLTVTGSHNTVGSSAANSFMGDPVSVDWDLDFNANNIYFGIATGSPAPGSGTPANPPGQSGQLIKIDTGNQADPTKWNISSLLSTSLPVLPAPSVTFDTNGNHWVYDGSGRFFTVADKQNLGATQQQVLFGVVDGSTTPTYSGLTDMSTATVSSLAANAATPITGINGSSTAVSEASAESTVLGTQGWKILLNTPGSGSSNLPERVLNATAVLGSTLFATAYTPNSSLCQGNGTSRLFGLNFLTGLPNPSNAALGINATVNQYYASIPLGAGLAAAPSLHLDTNPGSAGLVTVVTQTSTGSIVTNTAQVNPGLANAEVDWRQTHPNDGPQ